MPDRSGNATTPEDDQTQSLLAGFGEARRERPAPPARYRVVSPFADPDTDTSGEAQ